MKTKITLILMFLCLGVYAQTPEKINYQAVARDLSGNPVASQAISVVIEVRQGSASGGDVYKESHAVTTNAFGLFTLEIGGGTLLGGAFNTISWGTSSYYLYIEVDGNPIGASQLLSVPYALYSKESLNGPTGAQGPQGIGINWLGTLSSAPATPNLNDAYYNSTTGQSFIWDGATWQILAQDGTAGSLTGGPGISVLANVISNTGDLDSTNELQDLSITGNTINITQGTGANISATTPSTGDYLYWNGINWVAQTVPANTDNQNLINGGKSGNNQTIDIQNGTGVTFSIADGDSLSTNEIQQLSFATPNLTLSNGGGTVNLSSLSGPTYTAGTGISIVSNVITNTMPDQTVAITGSGATTVSGTYPNFTIASTDNVNDADFDPSNEYNTGFAVNGLNLEITDGGGTRQVPMSSFADSDWIPNGIAIRNGNAGNVGIGVFTPTRKLHVEDNSTAFATYIQQGNTAGDGLSVYSNTSVSARTIFSAVGNASGLYVKGNSDVGIGTNVPTEKLDVNGQIRMRTGAVNGYIPVANASGVMTWTDPSTLALGSAWLVNGTDIYNGNAGQVGIGTTSPTFPLEVRTTTNVRGAYIETSGTNSASSKIGVTGIAINGLGTGDNKGGSFNASGGSSGDNIGVEGIAISGTAANIGVRGWSTAGTGNWAGFFGGGGANTGDVHIQDNLRIGTVSNSSASAKVYIHTPTTSNIYTSIEALNEYNGGSLMYGYYNRMIASGTGGMTGMWNYMTPSASSSSTVYGYRNLIQTGGNGPRYGLYSSIQSSGSGDMYGSYNSLDHDGTGDVYGFRLDASGSTTSGNVYGLYITGPLNMENAIVGNTGIGVLNPVNRLDVEGAAVIGGTYSGTITAPVNGLLVAGDVGIGATAGGTKLMVNETGTNPIFRAQLNGGTNFMVANNGNTALYYDVAPAYKLTLNTNSAAKPTSNVWTVASDARLKKDIKPFQGGLNDVLKINPVWFTYNGKAGMPNETGVGIIAQELRKIAPYMVNEWEYTSTNEETGESLGTEKYLGVDNGAMTYMLINAIKEQQKMIEELKKEVELLKNK